MKVIALASDHAGFATKDKIINLIKDEFEIQDLGPLNEDRVDYPDYANKVCEAVLEGSDTIGILICGSGQGMAMRANKYKGIRAALCWNEESAELSRQHNNANVLCLGARLLELTTIEKIVKKFLSTDFEGGRHQKRVDKISL